ETNVNQTPLMLALAFEAGEVRSDAARQRLTTMLSSVVKEQRPDGSWGLMYVWEPFGSTPDVITNLALLSMTSPGAPDLGEAGIAAQAKGLAWLASAKTEETLQGSALKLLLWRRLGKPAAEQEPLVKQILGWQNSDGGWAQNKELKSDAYATGQALYALMEAGVPRTHPAIAKAHSFLVKSQDASGSWAMISRPGGPGGKSAKNQAPIGYVGTAWAVLGLMRSMPSLSKSETPAVKAAE
ncbi:MAG TPA: prenyltransferase/squalene oxidase repeat-containing protein, partial [Pirellulaceae bacterium]|nr:prenyltransferase/squalene oxidase repeat-containing protein [Pirellulaceae bacterium]